MIVVAAAEAATAAAAISTAATSMHRRRLSILSAGAQLSKIWVEYRYSSIFHGKRKIRK